MAKNKKGDPSWLRTFKIIVGVVAGIGIICGGAFTTWKFLQRSLTSEVSGRLDIIEGQVDMLIVSVDGLSTLVVDKKYEIDKDLVLMVMQIQEEKTKRLVSNTR